MGTEVKGDEEKEDVGKENQEDQKGEMGEDNEGFADDMQIDEVVEWIHANFKSKRCAVFVPKQLEKSTCHCGRDKSLHDSVYKGKTVAWCSKYHTKKEDTDAFGLVNFVKTEDTKTKEVSKVEYIRMADDTPSNKIANLMQDIWGLKDPKLLISVVGGHSNSTLRDDLKKIVETGIEKVLHSADVWLLTGGTNTGTSKAVAEVFRGEVKKDRLHRNACIGVVPWGLVNKREILLNEGDEVEMHIPSCDDDTESARKCLDHNHSHFLLVDNGSFDDYEFQHTFRVQLQKYFSGRGRRSLPSITILLEGGLSSVTAMHAALKSKPQIPVLVVKGSGRVADVVSEISLKYAQMSRPDRRRFRFNLLGDLHQKLSDALEVETQDPRTMTAARLLQECIEDYNSQIVIYDFEKEGIGLHQALLQACRASSTKGGEDDMFNNLQLAMLWDDLDVAKQDFSAGDIGNEALYKMIKNSLVAGKHEFVKILVKEKKVDLNDFLTEKMLAKLYMKKVKESQSVFARLLTKHEKKSFINAKEFSLGTIDRLLYSLLNEDYSPCYNKKNNRKKLITPVQELVIWSILNNMKDMVMVLLHLENNHLLGNCLIASRMCNALSEGVGEKTLAESFKQTGREFADMTIELLSYYYKYDADIASQFIKEKISLWGNHNLISLAADMDFMAFVAHPCCQKVLDEQWDGQGIKVNESWDEKIKQIYQPKPRRLSEVPRWKVSESHTRGDCCNSMKEVCPRIMLWPFVVPKGKLYIHVLLYLIFLALFSFYNLVKQTSAHDAVKWIVFVFVVGLTLDEIRQVVEVKKQSNLQKLKEWGGSVWNLLDAMSLILYLAGFITIHYQEADGKIVSSIALAIFYIKLFQFYRTNKVLGPYVVMIFRMLRHLAAFVSVLVIAMLAFGVVINGLLYQNQEPSWEVLFRIVYRPFFIIFGELNLENDLSSLNTVFGTKKVHDGEEIVLVIALCLYLLFASVLLINLLIAIFNNIYEKIKQNSHQIWKFEKYDMLQEFSSKPFLPVPFSIFENIYRLCIVCCRNMKCCKSKAKKDTRIFQTDDELLDFERRCVKNYWADMENKKTIMIEEHIVAINNRLQQQITVTEENQAKLEARFEMLERMIRRAMQTTNAPEVLPKYKVSTVSRPIIYRR